MSRPHIEFIHEQVLPWSEGLYGGGRPEVSVRTLSLDGETGASSVVVRYPPGWRRTEPEHVTSDEEFLVLRGSVEINGIEYDELSYAFLPAGHVRHAASSARGALVLTFFEGEPRAVPGAPPHPPAGDRVIERFRALDGDWGGNFHPQFPPGAGRKWLRREPDGESWILGTMPLRFSRRAEKHPVIEETFLLSGELYTPLGLMYPGAYFWRPPEIWHGPFGTKTGNLYLFRTRGGPLSTEYTEDARDTFDWEPAHRPVLPPELAELGSRPYDGRPAF